MTTGITCSFCNGIIGPFDSTIHHPGGHPKAHIECYLDHINSDKSAHDGELEALRAENEKLREALCDARGVIAHNIGDYGGVLGRIERALKEGPDNDR